ncbi:MAG: LLM class flavin-dependent oxidoreductase [Chloroflexi bacterium]|nr:LLM class flavin-dependent oxidoreductase [Chloroflexota bacterium]
MVKSKNPIWFGINSSSLPYERLVPVAKAAEAAGFVSMSFWDRPPENSLEGWTTATAVAVQTEKIIVTHSTLNVPYRNPALVAKMAATLDFITGGRLLLTLGAGGQEGHATAYGMSYGTPGERYQDLKDAIAIMHGLWKNDTFDYQGRRFKVQSASVDPKPVNGTVPIVIGAARPRMLRLTGAVADGWIKNMGWPESPEQYLGMLSLMEEGAEKAGRDPATIRRVLNGAGYIGNENRTGGLQGTANHILETVDEYVELGVDYFQLAFAPDGIEEQLRQFGEEVIAKVNR